MRRLLLAVVLLAPVALIGPSSAQTLGEGEGEGETATLNITKVVDGDGPTGGYVIEYSCEAIDLSPPAEGGAGGQLTFDAAGPGSPETQTVVLTSAGICTVTEIDSNGADTVTYACEFVPGEQPNGDSPDADESAQVINPGSCLDDQTAEITAPNDVATITVTNTFEADVIDEEEEPPAVDDDDVVTATPPFTG